MYCADSLAQRIQEPSESKEDCRRRVMRVCKDSWETNGPQGDALRRHWQLRAIQFNRSPDAIVPCLSTNTSQLIPQSSDLQFQYINHLLVHEGKGVLGIGDSSFGLSTARLSTVAESTPSFVKTFSRKWRNRAGGNDEAFAIDQPRSTRLACFETGDFCCAEITDLNRRDFQTLSQHLKKYVQAYRSKHLVSGRNKGPNASIQLPLLFMWNPNLLSLLRIIIFTFHRFQFIFLHSSRYSIF